MPVRIEDIELWSSWPIGRCWREGLNKWLVGSVALPRTSSSAARSFTENIPSGGEVPNITTSSTCNISNKKHIGVHTHAFVKATGFKSIVGPLPLLNPT